MVKSLIKEVRKNEHFPDFAIFVGFLLVQLLLRFLNLSYHGIWRDEVASLFFSLYPSEVIRGDSHSLFYYLFLSPVTYIDPLNYELGRWYESLVSFGLYVLIAVRSRKVMSKGQWIFFHTVYGIHPLVFGFARLLRPYILVLDLTTLLIIECKRFDSKKGIFFTALFLPASYPVALIPLLIEGVTSVQKKTLAKLFCLAALPTLIYYGVKFFVDPNTFSYVSWIKGDPLIFFREVTNLLAGSYFPYYDVYRFDAGPWIIGALTVLAAVSVIWNKNHDGKRQLLIFLGSFLFVMVGINLLAPFLDLRINRYFVFLFPYFLLALTFSLPPNLFYQRILTILAGGALLLQVVVVRPYFSANYSFGSFMAEIKTSVAMNGDAPVLACGYTYHNWYFKQHGFLVCSSEADLKTAETLPGILIYAYIDKQLFGLKPVVNRKKILSTNAYDSGNILVLGDIHGKPQK